MSKKIVIGVVQKQKQALPNKIVLGTLLKDAVSGATQERTEAGEFASEGGTVTPHGKNQMFVNGDKIRVGDIVHHGNPLMDGGRVIAITPAAPGKEDRGPRIKLQFKNGHVISNYFKPTVQFVVTRGTQAEPKTAPAKMPGGGKPADGGAKPVGGGKPDVGVKPDASVKPPAPQESSSQKEYAQKIPLSIKNVEVGDRITKLLNGLVVSGVVTGIKPVPGGAREVKVRKEDGSVETHVIPSSASVSCEPRVASVPSLEERRIPSFPVMDANGKWYGTHGSVPWEDFAVGNRITLPFNSDAPYGEIGTVVGDLVGIRDQGRGRIDYYVKTDGGNVYVKTYTAAQRAWSRAQMTRPVASESEWAQYKALAADKIKAEEEKRAKEEKEKLEHKAKIDNAKNLSTQEFSAFIGAVNARARELDASSPAAPFSAGDVRNGGWGITNAELAATCAKPGNLDASQGAQITKVNVGGAINAGTFRVEAADGSQLFAKRVTSGYKEIGNEVYASLLAQRLGLNYAATIPCYIRPSYTGSAVIITDPSKLPAGAQFNGVIMDRIRDANGNSLKTASHTSDATVQASNFDQMQRMMLLDALIGNSDRHDSNYFINPDPSIGVVPYDAGFGFNQQMNDVLPNRIPGLRANTTFGPIVDEIRQNTGDAIKPKTTWGISQIEALNAMIGMPLMTNSQTNRDGTVTLTPTPFAESLRQNVVDATADFMRSYQNVDLNVEMTSSPGYLSTGIFDNKPNLLGRGSGSGIGMIPGALSTALGANTVSSLSSQSDVTFNDPSNVLSVTKSIASHLKRVSTGKIKIGTLVRKAH